MDEFIKSHITSSAWSDATNDSLEPYGGGKNKISSILPANNIIGNSSADNLNLHGHYGVKFTSADGNMKYEDDKVLYCSERLSCYNLGDETLQPNLIDSDTYGRSYLLPDAVVSTPTVGSFVSEIPHNTVVISSSINNNGSTISNFSQVLGDAHSISSFPASWPSSYTGFSPFTGLSRFHGLGFQGLDTNGNQLCKASLGNAAYLNSSNAVPSHQKGQDEFQSFQAGQQINLTSGALQSEKEENGLDISSFLCRPHMTMNITGTVLNTQQFSTSSESFRTTNQTNNSGAQAKAAPTDANGCNGVAKPRARARRGQATDPHSIAERLRREKIAERMKNLQELVPSSNKTDKASMLDEIMDYVKFLQLQVKVLSMSRLGAAGAVLPLLANNQTVASGSVLVSPSAGEEGEGIFESGDSLAFEQEVVKLMETNITSAIQYLQNKGLCLMPIALATAISNHKGSYASMPPEYKKPYVTNGVSSLGSRNHIERTPDVGANSCNGEVTEQGVPKAA